jgi:hypothetical protein
MDREFSKLLSVFNFRDLQNFITILLVLEHNNRTIEDLIEYVDYVILSGKKSHTGIHHIALREENSIDSTKTRSCDRCDVKMLMYSVNTTRCNQVGSDLKTQWVCPNCEYEYFE